MAELKLLRKDKEGFSYYENPDKEMVKAIKKIAEEPLEWINNPSVFSHDKVKFNSILKNGKFLYENEAGDVFTLEQDQIDSSTERTRLEMINSQYSVADLFNQHFLPLQTVHNQLVEAICDPSMGSLSHYFQTNTFSVNTYQGLSIELSEGGSLAFISLTMEGEVKNRDYNHDLNNLQPLEGLDNKIQEVANKIRKFKSIEFDTKNKYFITDSKGDKYAYVFYKGDDGRGFKTVIGYDVYPLSSGDSYYWPGNSRNKITKSKKELVKITADNMIEILEKEAIEFFGQKEKPLQEEQ